MLWNIFERTVRTRPDHVAIIQDDHRWTYDEVGRRVRALAAFLRGLGLEPRDRISILDLNTRHFLELTFAAAGQGLILNPLNVRLAAAELALILQDVGSRWLVSHASFAPLVHQLLELEVPLEGVIWTEDTIPLDEGIASINYECAIANPDSTFTPVPMSPHHVVHIYYTSGTTGVPKGVMLTAANIATHSSHVIKELALNGDDVWGHLAPMFHLADAWATIAITEVGGTHVMLPRFDAEVALKLVERHAVTLSNLVPTMLNAMVKHPAVVGRGFPKLRMILSGGAPIAPDLVQRIMKVFRCEYVQTYGMTETSPYLTLSLLSENLRKLSPDQQFHYRAKTGRPFLGIDLRVVDPSGNAVPADDRTVGEIWVKGPTVTPGYWNRPEETAAAFHDGWLKTGDLAVHDDRGFVNIVDRKKDVIITGGEKVYSTEVENHLYAHPAILEAAVFGRPDATWGEAVTAAVVLRPGMSLSESDLLAYLRPRLTHFKLPKSIEFHKDLPKTGTGKISKRSLRDFAG